MAVKELVVKYGMGAECRASLEESALEGLPVRDVIRMVVDSPQLNEAARRTAGGLDECIRSRRIMDVELIKGKRKDGERGTPIELNDIVIGRGDQSTETDSLTILVSEPYQGG